MGTKYFILFYLLIVIQFNTSCVNKDGNPKAIKREISKSIPSINIDTNNVKKIFDKKGVNDSLRIEVFDIDEALINGKLPLNTNYKKFLELLGKEDSITNYTREMYSSFSDTVVTQTLHKNNSKFEIFQDQLKYDAIRFNVKTFVIYKNHKLSHETTIEDFSKVFPNASKEVGQVDVFDEGIQKMISLRESENPKFEGRINFMFKNDSLVEFHWWVP